VIDPLRSESNCGRYQAMVWSKDAMADGGKQVIVFPVLAKSTGECWWTLQASGWLMVWDLFLPQYFSFGSWVVGPRGNVMKYKGFGFCVGGILFLLVVMAFPASAYYVSSDYYVYATDSDGIPIRGDVLLMDETYVDGDYTKSGGSGNYGSAAFYANMFTATVSAQAYAHGVKTDTNHFQTGTGRVEDISFLDLLTYTVPAGYYPDGVQVSIGGSANGIIASDVGAGSRVQCYVSLYTETFDTGILEVGVDDEGMIQVNEDFMLTVELVPPGSTLVNPQDFNRELRVGIYNGRTWSVQYNTGSGYVTGDGYFDFSDGLEITQSHIPPGVTWTSESGVFPNFPSSVQDGTLPMQAPRLLQNHPNPFNPRTTIVFDLPQQTTVSLRVFDVAGRLVRELLDRETVAEGRREVAWNGRDDTGGRVASGTYFYRLEAGEFSETRRMALIK